LKNDNIYTKRHRGSSPPFQIESQESFDFMKDHQSVYQNPDDTIESQDQKQERFKSGKPINQKFSSSQANELNLDQIFIDDK